MNHTRKSIALFVFLVIIFFSAAFPVHGEINLFNQSYTFTLSGGMGFLYGTSHEIVYLDSKSKDYISELQWNIKPLFYMGLTLDFGPKNPQEKWGLFSSLGIKTALPMETGVMEDRDWLYPCTVPGALTHFSSHENHTKAAFLLNLDSGFSLPVWKLVLKFYLNLDYMYYKWEGRNGYIQYGDNVNKGTLFNPIDPNDPNTWFIPWSPGFTKIPISGLGITYTQHWILFTTGTGTELYLDRFIFSIAFFIGLPICIAVDEHHMRDPPFRTTAILTPGFVIKPKIGVCFPITEHFETGFYVSYLYIGKNRGDTKSEESGSSVIYKNTEGASFKALEANLIFKYNF